MKEKETEMAEVIQHLIQELASLKKAWPDKSTTYSNKRYFSLKDASIYIGRKESTMYQYSSKRIIPSNKPNGKDVIFDITDLDNFLSKNHRKSKEEIELEAENFLSKKKKGDK